MVLSKTKVKFLIFVHKIYFSDEFAKRYFCVRYSQLDARGDYQTAFRNKSVIMVKENWVCCTAWVCSLVFRIQILKVEGFYFYTKMQFLDNKYFIHKDYRFNQCKI